MDSQIMEQVAIYILSMRALGKKRLGGIFEAGEEAGVKLDCQLRKFDGNGNRRKKQVRLSESDSSRLFETCSV